MCGVAPKEKGKISMAKSPVLSQDFEEAIVSLCFDDNHACLVHIAEPILRERGLRGTFFVYTDGVHIPPRNPENMTVDDLFSLVQHGQEVGSHAVHHQQLTQVSESDALAEVRDSREWFERQGIPVTSFAYPLASLNDTIRGYVEMYYQAGRTTGAEVLLNQNTSDRYTLSSYRIAFPDDPPSLVKGCIARAIAEKAWLILVFHHVHPQATSRLEYSIEDFGEVCDYIVSTGIKCAPIGDVVKG
jgi:peptidoglycan/xylan/chitin deacetylase (PgdA/CDA1 family)